MGISTDERARELPGPVALKVTDEYGHVMVNTTRAKRGDFIVSIDLPGGRAVLDLYGHYQHKFVHQPDRPYEAYDALCKTYEKFGNAIQDRLSIVVRISPG